MCTCSTLNCDEITRKVGIVLGVQQAAKSIVIMLGPWHIIGAGPLDPPPPTQPLNGILDPEFSKIKKYLFVFHALKSFLCIYKKRKNYTSII
jgi:hypothetical protein